MRNEKERYPAVVVLGVLILCSAIALAQDVAIIKGQEGQQPSVNAGSGAGVSPVPTIGSPGTVSVMPQTPSLPTVSVAPSYSGVTPTPSTSSNSYGGFGGGSTVSTPRFNYEQYINPYTSFYDYNSYWRFTSLFGLLQRNFGYAFNDRYFSRYYMNREPILNRQTLYFSLKESAAASRQLKQAALTLQKLMVSHSGDSMAATRDPQWAQVTESIRNLAKQIRQDRLVEYIDVRRDIPNTSSLLVNLDKLDFQEQVSRLNDLIQQLDTQLSQTWKDAQPSVVSVQSLNRPSFQSLAKGIETLAKRLEKSPRG